MRRSRLRALRMAAVLVLLTAGGVAAGPAQEGDAPVVRLVEQAPVSVRAVGRGIYLVDFGRVAFGNLVLRPEGTGAGAVVTVRFGEALRDGRVDRRPPGSVRFAEVTVRLDGSAAMRVSPKADVVNTRPLAVKTPAAWGVVLPFRWVEVEGWPGELRAEEVRREAAFDATWRDDAGEFRSSDEMLNRIWGLCHYTIKAATFAGIFVDGDRERLAYEADASLTQLGYYAGDADPRMARATFARLMRYPTWPTEWAPHMVFMAYADWMVTGDRAWLAANYEGLKTKLLDARVGADGLVTSNAQQMGHDDIVDWPAGERDGFVFTRVNTVVNAFHLRALALMSEMAAALGKRDEAERYAARERAALAVFNEKLFDAGRGVYRDGEGTEHASQHASLFPLAFGLVPEAERGRVAEWVAGRGMRVSPYAAEYLMEGLFENGEDAAALGLMEAPGDRSWRHMVESGTTMTWEAWDQRYKPNQDWNHAWGAAPANLLPRFVLGVRVREPGWSEALIQPHVGGLASAEGRVPTPRGEIAVSWKKDAGFAMTVELPRGVKAKVELPVVAGTRGVWVEGKRVAAERVGEWWVLGRDLVGRVEVEER